MPNSITDPKDTTNGQPPQAPPNTPNQPSDIQANGEFSNNVHESHNASNIELEGSEVSGSVYLKDDRETRE